MRGTYSDAATGWRSAVARPVPLAQASVTAAQLTAFKAQLAADADALLAAHLDRLAHPPAPAPVDAPTVLARYQDARAAFEVAYQSLLSAGADLIASRS